MKKLGIIIASLLICSISYAGYVTIEKEKMAIGDDTKVIGELPIQKRVEVVGETTNRYIIKHNSHLAGIAKKHLRFPKDEQPYIYPYVGMLEQIYEVTLELYEGEEYKVIKEDKTRYLIEYRFKDTPIEIWIEKNYVSYNASSKLDGLVKYQGRWITPEERVELEQEAKGLVKYQDKWITPEEKFELEQEARGLFKDKEGEWITPEEFSKREKEIIKLRTDEYNTHRKILEEYILNLAVFNSDSSNLTKSELLQKYGEDFEFKTLVAIDSEIGYCLNHLEQMGKGWSIEYNSLLKINKKYKKELEQWAKGLVEYQGKLVTQEEKFELEQKAKGLIKYKDKWITQQEMDKILEQEKKEKEYEQQQTAKGLIKYNEQWVTPDEQFELEQNAKGFIKYEGNWLTHDQMQEAKGLVKFRDQWITPQERDKILEEEKYIKEVNLAKWRKLKDRAKELEICEGMEQEDVVKAWGYPDNVEGNQWIYYDWEYTMDKSEDNITATKIASSTQTAAFVFFDKESKVEKYINKGGKGGYLLPEEIRKYLIDNNLTPAVIIKKEAPPVKKTTNVHIHKHETTINIYEEKNR